MASPRPKLVQVAEFRFRNHPWDLLDKEVGDYSVRIFRRCRTQPYVGMKQPVPVGAIMGLETALEVRYQGQRRPNLVVRLFRNNIRVFGATLEAGDIDDLKIPLDDEAAYKMLVFVRERPAEASPLASTASEGSEPS